MEIPQIKIGADPELFVWDTVIKKFVSAHNLIPGDKQNPFGVVNGAIQVDGVAAEFNIYPQTNATGFIEAIESVSGQLLEEIDKKNPDAILVAEPVADFDQKYFDSLPSKAKLLGCEPDFNAYTMSMNTPPYTDKPFRTGAGHIHIGWTKGKKVLDKQHFAVCAGLVRELDKVLYPASMDWDPCERRRELYGSKGSFRPKHYGVEYRPLSNAWVDIPEVMDFIFSESVEITRKFFERNNVEKAA